MWRADRFLQDDAGARRTVRAEDVMSAKVVDWISSDEALDKTESVGGLGGWFGHDPVTGSWDEPHRWKDYLAKFDFSVHPYLEALKDDVLASNRFICGNEHQDLENGIPLFDDGTVGVFSFRGWGDLMAAIATESDRKNHNYMEFYCS
jgi:hypothetical protein